MNAAENWFTFFREWPESLPRSGVMLSNLNEAMPFRNFWLKGEMLLLERTVPDAMGGRFLLVGFDIINSVKFTVPLTGEAISAAGFAESESHELQASCL